MVYTDVHEGGEMVYICTCMGHVVLVRVDWEQNTVYTVCHVSAQLLIGHAQSSQPSVMGHHRSIPAEGRVPKHSVEVTEEETNIGVKVHIMGGIGNTSGKLHRRVK